MSTQSFLPTTVLDAAQQMGSAYTAQKQSEDPQNLLAELHNTVGNQAILSQVHSLSAGETAGELGSGERVPVSEVLGFGGAVVADYLGQPGLLVDFMWQEELAEVAAGAGSILGQPAHLVDAADLYDCKDIAECERDLNRDIGFLDSVLPEIARGLQHDLQSHAEMVLSQPSALKASVGLFSVAADVGVRTLAAASGLPGLIGASATATLHTRIRSRVSASILSFAQSAWADGSAVEQFFSLFAQDWMKAVVDTQGTISASEDFEQIQGLARWARHTASLGLPDLRSCFRGSILEPFLSMAATTTHMDGAHTSGALSGVYNFNLQFAFNGESVAPLTLGLPQALPLQDQETLMNRPGLWQTQVFQLVNADQSLLAKVAPSGVSIIKMDPGVRPDLEEHGCQDASELDSLRLKASEGDRSAVDYLTRIAERGVERLWEQLLDTVGRGSSFQQVPDLTVLGGYR